MSFITDILNFFVGLLNASRKQYNKLSEWEQTVGQYASGLIAIVNKDLQAVPADVWDVISATFPALTKDVVTGYLNSAGKIVGIINQNATLSFEDALTLLQGYLGKHTGNVWVAITQGIVSILVAVINPSKEVQPVTSIMEYIYQDIVKPLIHGVEPATASITEADSNVA